MQFGHEPNPVIFFFLPAMGCSARTMELIAARLQSTSWPAWYGVATSAAPSLASHYQDGS
jgi:hypothetical protein